MEVKLFANLAEEAGTRTVEVDLAEGATVADALAAIFERYPTLRAQILAEDGSIEEHITVLVEGSNVSHRDEGLDTPVERGTELAIFPPVSGG